MRRIAPIAPAKSVADQVRDGLRDAIVDGQFAMGENISEERLTALFGVSRSPVRDALNALKFIGLVEILPKRGSFVFLPGAAEVADRVDGGRSDPGGGPEDGLEGELGEPVGQVEPL